MSLKLTIDHGEIKRWAEGLGGKPEIIDELSVKNDRTGIRINFPGRHDEKWLGSKDISHPASWEEFFSKFDHKGLAFLYYDPIPPRVHAVDAYRFEPRLDSKASHAKP